MKQKYRIIAESVTVGISTGGLKKEEKKSGLLAARLYTRRNLISGDYITFFSRRLVWNLGSHKWRAMEDETRLRLGRVDLKTPINSFSCTYVIVDVMNSWKGAPSLLSTAMMLAFWFNPHFGCWVSPDAKLRGKYKYGNVYLLC